MTVPAGVKVTANMKLPEVENLPCPEDIFTCQAVVFEWAESYDTKDWDRLARCIAPTLNIDYRTVLGKMWDALPAMEFVKMISSPHFLGNSRIRTQHGIGASKWVQHDDNTIMGYHQMRVAHQKYYDEDNTTVQYQGHAYGKAVIQYRLFNGTWKFAGLEPDIRWYEHDYHKIFDGV